MPFLVLGAVGGYVLGGSAVGAAVGLSAVGGAVLGGTLGASIDSRIAQQKELNRASAAQQREFKLRQEQADIERARAARVAIRQQRLAQAQMLNLSYQTGGAGSSALSGGIASTQAQTGGRIGQLNQVAGMNVRIGETMLDQARATSSANTYGTIGEITQTIFGNIGGYQAIGKGIGTIKPTYTG